MGFANYSKVPFCFVCERFVYEGGHTSPLRWCRRILFLVSSLRICVCVCACLMMCVLHQLRQVSQAKRWDDVGTGRRTIRQSRVVESLDFPDEDFGVNLGIVSV